MADRNSIFQQHDFSSAVDFLDALSPRRKPFFDAVDPWVYRGHGNSEYELLASVRRHPELVRRRIATATELHVRAQIIHEADLLSRFYQLCFVRGLNIPEDSHIIRSTIGNYRLGWSPKFPIPPFEEGIRAWPPDELLPILALAQHFGLPTCLLDWTRRSYVAAFFAADDAMRLEARGKPSNYLSVWCLHLAGFTLPTFNVVTPVAPQIPVTPHPGISVTSSAVQPGPFAVVMTPGATNERLQAQAGLFLVHRPNPDDRLPFVPWEQVLIQDANEPFWPMIYHYRLASAEARRMLKLLEAEGITHSSLFPGMAGVAQEVLMQLGLYQQ